jgi:hypothetical protein
MHHLQVKEIEQEKQQNHQAKMGHCTQEINEGLEPYQSIL